MNQIWTFEDAQQLLALPFIDLLYHAQTIHRSHFDPNQIQLSSLLSIKTGACPEDCKYCPQSGHHNTGLKKEKLMAVEKVMAAAKKAKANGATRFCMGAAWRNPPAQDFETILLMVKSVKALGLETCMTLGMLSAEQSAALAAVGLDYYNHNLDTSPEYYNQIISTRTYADRLETLSHVRDAGIKLCVGGIIGLGEQQADRIKLLLELANMSPPPESVPINMLIKIAGTPLADAETVDPFDFVRIVALARIMMPKTYVRLSAGREHMNDQTQAWAFMAGANSIFYGDVLLTAENPDTQRDQKLFARLGMIAQGKDMPFSNYKTELQKQATAPEPKPLFYNAAL